MKLGQLPVAGGLNDRGVEGAPAGLVERIVLELQVLVGHLAAASEPVLDVLDACVDGLRRLPPCSCGGRFLAWEEWNSRPLRSTGHSDWAETPRLTCCNSRLGWVPLRHSNHPARSNSCRGSPSRALAERQRDEPGLQQQA